MAQPYEIAVLVGSLRKASLNRKTALALGDLAPDTLRLQIIEIGDLPLYNEDSDESPPPAYASFRQQVAAADAVLFVTPEYNRSVPGALKNAIDVGSRPYGKAVWTKKPAGIVTVSPGAIGGFGANHHLRQSLVFLDMPCLQQPEAYVGGAGTMFDEQGVLAERSAKFLKNFIDAYAQWVARLLPRAA